MSSTEFPDPNFEHFHSSEIEHRYNAGDISLLQAQILDATQGFPTDPDLPSHEEEIDEERYEEYLSEEELKTYTGIAMIVHGKVIPILDIEEKETKSLASRMAVCLQAAQALIGSLLPILQRWSDQDL